MRAFPIRWALNPMTSVLNKKRREAQMGDGCVTEAGTGELRPQVQGRLGPQKLGQVGRILPSSLWRECGSVTPRF